MHQILKKACFFVAAEAELTSANQLTAKMVAIGLYQSSEIQLVWLACKTALLVQETAAAMTQTLKLHQQSPCSHSVTETTVWHLGGGLLCEYSVSLALIRNSINVGLAGANSMCPEATHKVS